MTNNLREWNYSSADLTNWYILLLSNTTGPIREIVMYNPDATKKALNSYFNTLHNYAYSNILNKVRETMSRESFDFRTERFKELIIELEKEVIPAGYEFLGIEPESVINYLAEKESYWFTNSFQFPYDNEPVGKGYVMTDFERDVSTLSTTELKEKYGPDIIKDLFNL